MGKQPWGHTARFHILSQIKVVFGFHISLERLEALSTKFYEFNKSSTSIVWLIKHDSNDLMLCTNNDVPGKLIESAYKLINVLYPCRAYCSWKSQLVHKILLF